MIPLPEIPIPVRIQTLQMEEQRSIRWNGGRVSANVSSEKGENLRQRRGSTSLHGERKSSVVSHLSQHASSSTISP